MASNDPSHLASGAVDLGSSYSLREAISELLPGDPEFSHSSPTQSPSISVKKDSLLHDRVAALEAQLGRAISEKISTEESVQLALQLLSQIKAWSTANVSAIEESAKLRSSVRNLKQENNRLKTQLADAQASQDSIVKAFCSVLKSKSQVALHPKGHKQQNPAGSQEQMLPNCQYGALPDPAITGALQDHIKSTSTTSVDSLGGDTSATSDTDLLDLFDTQPRLKSSKHISNKHEADIVDRIVGSLLDQPNDVPYFADTAHSEHGWVTTQDQGASSKEPATTPNKINLQDSGTSISIAAEESDMDLIELEGSKSNKTRSEGNDIPIEDNQVLQAPSRPLKKFDPGAYRYATSSLSILPDFFKYGIRYIPAEETPNVFRTLMVTNLPSNISLGALLNQIRGGSLISATILDSRSITGSMSAMIVFFQGSSATRYAEHCQQHGLEISGQVARVTKVATATWPLSEALRKAIHHHNHTRCLVVEEFPRWISMDALRFDLGVRAQPGHRLCSIEHMDFDESGSLHIRFSSVSVAGEAYETLSSLPRYQQAKVFFSPDPCAAPLVASGGGYEVESLL